MGNKSGCMNQENGERMGYSSCSVSQAAAMLIIYISINPIVCLVLSMYVTATHHMDD